MERNGTKFSNDKTSPRHWHVSFSARVVHKYVLPSLRLSVRTRFYYTQFHIFVTRVLHIFPSIHSYSAMKSLNFDLLSTVVSSYFTLFGCLGWLWSFFFGLDIYWATLSFMYSLKYICMLQDFFFSSWLAGSWKQVWIFLFRSVPLNIITGVDNYTLRNGTEQSLVMAKQTPTICMIPFSYSARVVRKYVLPSLRPSLRLSVLTRFYYSVELDSVEFDKNWPCW